MSHRQTDVVSTLIANSLRNVEQMKEALQHTEVDEALIEMFTDWAVHGLPGRPKRPDGMLDTPEPE